MQIQDYGLQISFFWIFNHLWGEPRSARICSQSCFEDLKLIFWNLSHLSVECSAVNCQNFWAICLVLSYSIQNIWSFPSQSHILELFSRFNQKPFEKSRVWDVFSKYFKLLLVCEQADCIQLWVVCDTCIPGPDNSNKSEKNFIGLLETIIQGMCARRLKWESKW